jgi:uncharacterized lipoprotein YddW (UPF0748 family)
VFAVCGALAVVVAGGQSARSPQLRAIWVDTFNTPLNTHNDIRRVVDGVMAAHANVLLVQVRRRGDAWYLDAKEPPPDFTPIATGFDPLADLIDTAHAARLQVHAFVIVGAVWNKDPALAPPGNGPPLSPDHVFNRHGGYDAGSRTIVPGPDNWLTRTLLPDGAGISYQGHRIGSEFYLDLGHPAAATYTVDVLAHLVRRYDLDGLHLDRIRYPELAVSGQTSSTGANIGYNAVSVARFLRRHQRPPDTVPAPSDAQWADWRRAQVTNFVRRVYLTVAAIKPHVVVSAALIGFGGAPSSDDAWRTSEAYWRVYQDWRAWMREGILDVGFVMNYKREHDASQARQFDDWLAFIGARQHDRLLVAGIGAHLNGVEGSVRQARRALQTAPGLALFAFATASDAVAVNPYSWPPHQATPRRPFDELAAALVQGYSRDGRFRYEPPDAPPPVFVEPVAVPLMPWKTHAPHGHLAGVATMPDGTPLDSWPVRIVDLRSRLTRTVETDGSGFFGAVDLAPGGYAVIADVGSIRLADRLRVVAGQVAVTTLPSVSTIR